MPEESGDMNNPGGQDGASQARMLEMLKNMQGAGGADSRSPQNKKDGFWSFALSLWGSFRKAHSVQQMTPGDAVVAFVAPPALAFIALLLVGMLGCAICAAIVAVTALAYSSVMFLMSAFKLVKYGLDTKGDSARPAKGRGGHPDIGQSVPARTRPPSTGNSTQSNPAFKPAAGARELGEFPGGNTSFRATPSAPMSELEAESYADEDVPTGAHYPHPSANHISDRMTEGGDGYSEEGGVSDPDQTEVKVRPGDMSEEGLPNPDQVTIHATMSGRDNKKKGPKIT